MWGFNGNIILLFMRNFCVMQPDMHTITQLPMGKKQGKSACNP